MLEPLRKASVILQELGAYNVSYTTSSEQFSFSYSRLEEIFVSLKAASRVFEFATNLQLDNRLALVFMTKMKEAAYYCREHGCNFFPQSNESGIILEITCSLPSCGVNFETISELLFSLEASYLDLFKLFDPTELLGQEVLYGYS